MSQERLFPESDILLSTTDVDSKIKYANDKFCDIAGYTLDEMVGNPHNMVRHPDMPKEAFKNLWSFIQDGKSWMGPVKNKCKNGDYYWVNAFVTPIKDESGKVYEYQSVRTSPDRKVVDRASTVYEKINKGELPLALKFTTDITAWTQIVLIVLSGLSLLSIFLSPNSTGLNVAMLFISLVGTSLFSIWRIKYKKVVNQSKDVFDNPLMSYIYSGNNDDIGAIDLAIKIRAAGLKAVVGRVSDDSITITEAASKSAQCGSEIAQILKDQKSETDQVATAVNQMSASIADVSHVVVQASSAAQQGFDITASSKKVVSQTVNAIQELSTQLNDVSNAISRLVNGSKAITAVLNEISSIANQTNLLALNAAIEAARAGEQGRGFAVVAEEVRALALRSQQSTEEISELLGQLHTESESATQAMVKGSELSNVCVDLAGETGESLEKITKEVTELTDISAQIATAVEQQTVVAEQVSKNIVSINDMSSESEEYGRESVTLSQDVLNKLHDQQSLVAQFKS